jgi:acyl-coenzyme A synthetase/AMP-(fatty) acid ligase
MSFTFDAIINPVILLAAVIAGAVAGSVVGKVKLNKSRSRIKQLEKELMQCNEETLEAQRAYVILESRLTDQSSPVIPMKINGSKENSKEKASK